MSDVPGRGFTPLALCLLAVAVMQGCSGPHEDPRVTLCRSLAANLAETAKDVEWESAGNRIKEPEYAAVKVSADGDRTATCFYEYEAVEQDVLTHVDPLSAYATLPYDMTLNGHPVPALKLMASVTAEQIKAGQVAFEKAQERLDEAARQLIQRAGETAKEFQQRVEETSRQLRKTIQGERSSTST